MLSNLEVEELNDAIQRMERSSIAWHLSHFPARFPVDFTPDFLNREPLPRLKHILFGLCLHNQKMINVAMAA